MFDDFSNRQEDKFPSRDSRVWQDSQETIRYVTASTTVSPDDDYILVDSTGGIVTVTLPDATTHRKITVIKTAGGSNVVIAPVGTDTINGAATYTITSSYTPMRLKGVTGGYIGI